MIALAVVWLMTWLVGVGWLIVAWPETTVPPCGAASAALAKPRQIATLSGWNANKRRWRSAVGAILVGRFFIRRSLGLLVRRQRGQVQVALRDALSERLVGEEIDARTL